MPRGSLEQDVEKVSRLPLVPRKPGWPLIGNIEFASGDSGKTIDSMDGMTRLKLLHQDIVIMPEHHQAEKLYRLEGTHVRGGASVNSFIQLFGPEALVIIHGPKHKALRNTLLPCFRPSDLIKTAQQIQSISSRRLKALEEQRTFEAGYTVEELTFELGMAFVGVDYNSISIAGRTQEFIQSVHALTDAIVSVPINLGSYSKFGRGLKARRNLLELSRDTIRKRKQQASAGRSESAGDGRFMVNDVLQRMIDARDEDGKPLSEETLMDIMLTFVIAGFDTTCSSMWALMINLCRFPDVQDKVHEKIRDVLGAESDEYKGNVSIPEEKWQDLEYVDQLVLESQRYDPPMANSSQRIATADFELDGYRIKKNTVLLVDMKTRSRSARYWDRPEEFDPDRFDRSLPDYKRKVAQLSTFGGGTRTCIGKGFAQLEQKVFATLLIRDYKIEFADPNSVPNVTYPLFMVLDGPMQVRITRRQN